MKVNDRENTNKKFSEAWSQPNLRTRGYNSNWTILDYNCILSIFRTIDLKGGPTSNCSC